MPNWDVIFSNQIRDEENSLWKEPHERLVDYFNLFDGEIHPLKILDLGCGTGRHLVYLTSKGYDVYGLDVSPSGLFYSRSLLSKQALPVKLSMADMTKLPFPSASFDIVISTYVIHHNFLSGVQAAIREIHRILLPGGTVLLTIPSTRGYRFTSGTQIEPGTVIPKIGKDHGIPHHYMDLKDVAAEFFSFIIRSIQLDEVITDEGYLSSHWFIQVEKSKEEGE